MIIDYRLILHIERIHIVRQFSSFRKRLAVLIGETTSGIIYKGIVWVVLFMKLQYSEVC